MWKAAGAGAIALLIAGSAAVYAQQRPGGEDAPRAEMARHGDHRAQRRRLSQDDIAALIDARLAALKAGLRLTPEQEKNWPAAETAIRDYFKERQDRMRAARERMAEPRDRETRDPIDRLRSRARTMSERAAALTRLADATEPLYNSLDDSQKRRLQIMTRQMRPHAHHRPGRDGQGPRPGRVERL